MYYSQSEEDIFLNTHFFKDKKKGNNLNPLLL